MRRTHINNESLQNVRGAGLQSVDTTWSRDLCVQKWSLTVRVWYTAYKSQDTTALLMEHTK